MANHDVTARVVWSDGWWAITVPEIEGLFTQAREYDEIEEMVRDAADVLGVPVGRITIVPMDGR